jgi:DNA mismatch endonuclease (patch repair protein)
MSRKSLTNNGLEVYRLRGRRHLCVETDAGTSARMRRIRQRNTGPENLVRKQLHALGHRYRVKNRDLPGSPDVANRRKKWAIFVHGCFWHHHDGCKLATVPKRNREFWEGKFTQNRERDAKAVRNLRSRGYRVITIWQCQTGDSNSLVPLLESSLATYRWTTDHLRRWRFPEPPNCSVDSRSRMLESMSVSSR